MDSNLGPCDGENSTFIPNAFGISNMSENIIAASS